MQRGVGMYELYNTKHFITEISKADTETAFNEGMT